MQIITKSNKIIFRGNLKMIFKIMNNIFLLSFLIFLSSCEDLFLRFEYQTIDCKKNSFNLDKISIRDDAVGSFADVQFKDVYYKIKIYKNDEKVISLRNGDLDIEIDILKKSEEVRVSFKNTIKKLTCAKKTFKM
ncbi:MAG: hypothetical protein CBC25_01320 [Pelagibacteraceae bacterium TMED65]|nr:hypothetical protein [Rickettsiales bacterium]OUU53128.1 MAG: hypothetical protein CBC25_01320 [Pelagibacteraceae bacterium TMED65]